MTFLMSHHSLFCLIRLAASDGGFFTTIQNMMAVATDNAYLYGRVSVASHDDCNSGVWLDIQGICLPGKDVLRVVISQIYLCRPTYRNAGSFPIIRFQKILF